MRSYSTVGLLVTLASVLIAGTLCASAGATTYGQKKKGVKGRYLELGNDVDLNQYQGALVILDPAEITANRDRPVDTESISSYGAPRPNRFAP